MPPKSKKGAGGTKKKKAAENSNNSNNSGNNEGRTKRETAKKKAPATKGPSKKGTLALCLDENKASKELPGNRVILKCLDIKKGLSAADAALSFGGNRAFEKPAEEYTEFHLCRGKPGKIPKVASRVNIPQKPFKRALYRCYTRGATVEALEKKAEEEFAGENSSPESRYSRSPESSASSKESSNSSESSSSSNSAVSFGRGMAANNSPANGPSSRTRSKARGRAKSANIYTRRLRVRRGSSVGPGKVAPERGALQLNAGLLKRLRRMAQPKPPAGPPPQEKPVLKAAEVAARPVSERFLAEGKFANVLAAFKRKEAEAAAARSPVPSLKKGASGP